MIVDQKTKKHSKLLAFFSVFGLIVVTYLLYVQGIHFIYGQTCFTTQTVSSDSRCLYILSGSVYEKGTKSKPHQGNACGTDITNVIPSFHAGDAVRYLDPNFVGKICTVSPSPTPTSIPTPTRTPTPIPSNCSTKSLGDADCNGLFNLVDFEIWRKEFTGSLSTKTADFNNDNMVSIIDFEIWRKSAIH